MKTRLNESDWETFKLQVRSRWPLIENETVEKARDNAMTLVPEICGLYDLAKSEVVTVLESLLDHSTFVSEKEQIMQSESGVESNLQSKQGESRFKDYFF